MDTVQHDVLTLWKHRIWVLGCRSARVGHSYMLRLGRGNAAYSGYYVTVQIRKRGLLRVCVRQSQLRIMLSSFSCAFRLQVYMCISVGSGVLSLSLSGVLVEEKKKRKENERTEGKRDKEMKPTVILLSKRKKQKADITFRVEIEFGCSLYIWKTDDVERDSDLFGMKLAVLRSVKNRTLLLERHDGIIHQASIAKRRGTRNANFKIQKSSSYYKTCPASIAAGEDGMK